MMLHPTGILLTAGQGTHPGANKLLHRLADRTPLAVTCTRLHPVPVRQDAVQRQVNT